MLTLEQIRQNLPKYLAPKSLNELFEGIKQFPASFQKNISSTYHLDDENLFQGDIIDEVEVYDSELASYIKIRAIIISNTCDITSENQRDAELPISVCYVRTLEHYKKMYREYGKSETQLNDKIAAIKKQLITNLMYIPSVSGKTPEFIVHLEKGFRLSNTQTIRERLVANRLISFNNLGFYVLLNKISIHYCRFWEKVDRG